MFKGSFTALVTPFNDTGIDFKAFQDLIEYQIEGGTEGVVVCGTTGETPTLSEEEQKELVKQCVNVVGGRIAVLAGVGTNSTEKTIHMAQEISKIGVDGLMVVTPYYNKPTQAGLIHHYKAVHDSVNVPILMYTVPGRTGIDISIETIKALSVLPRIVGIKDATNNLSRPVKTRLAISRDNFCQLSGEDGTVVAFLAQGGDGCVSVSSNIAPRMCSELHKAWRRGDFEKVSELRDKLQPLHEAMFIETSPGPAKYALSLLGLCSSQTRQPLWEISDISKQVVKEALEKLGLLG